jgi:hypothetical protein
MLIKDTQLIDRNRTKAVTALMGRKEVLKMNLLVSFKILVQKDQQKMSY